MSTLAIEDCLISKLSTLFRSNNVIDMSSEDISALAGETQESSQERKRLETKRRVLETGLERLKSFHKRRNIVHPPQLDQVTPKSPKQTSAMTSNRAEKASIATNGAEAPPVATTSYYEPSHSPEQVVVPLLVDEWQSRTGLQVDTEDVWAPIPRANKKHPPKQSIVEKPLADREWAY